MVRVHLGERSGLARSFPCRSMAGHGIVTPAMVVRVHPGEPTRQWRVHQDMGKLGIPRRSGRRERGFESRYPDQPCRRSMRAIGMWRSLVAHRSGGPGAAGSNPVFPTRTQCVLSPHRLSARTPDSQSGKASSTLAGDAKSAVRARMAGLWTTRSKHDSCDISRCAWVGGLAQAHRSGGRATCGRGPIGRARRSQRRGCGFEPRRPLGTSPLEWPARNGW